MRILISTVILLFMLFLGWHISIAGEVAYTCKVMHVYDLDDNGSLRISNWEKQFKDSEFSVSRNTGEVIGVVISTHLANSTKVINRGDKKYSFKSIADFDAIDKSLSSGNENAISTASFQLLEIQEFHDGGMKPFVAMSMGGAGIVTGLCK
ncbi:MAG: hypothetical protein V1897_03925 [Pseudomonadota bacterium]